MHLLLKLKSLIPHNRIKHLCSRVFSNFDRKPPWRVLFFGTDEFSVYTLEALTKAYRQGNLINRLEVVTNIKGKPNSVLVYSKKENLHVHKWPVEVETGTFDVGLVVSFGHLIPENIIQNFEFGMLNVHASLLPRWRGAAPIIYAIANGDRQTGITIMRISPRKFDVGEIVSQASVPIDDGIKMPELHAQLGRLGASNLIQTLQTLPTSLENAKAQPTIGVTSAPKVNQDFSSINWNTMTSVQIYNLERALISIFPLQTTWKNMLVKLINISISDCNDGSFNNRKPGFVEYDKRKKCLRIVCVDKKLINVEKVGIQGKKIMSAKDFDNGFLRKEADCRYFE